MTYNSLTLTKNDLFNSLGDLLSLQKVPGGITGETSFGKFRVIIYDHSIIRISATQGEEFEDFSYSVIMQPKEVDFTVEETDQKISIRTSGIHLEIQTHPVRFTFYDHHGQQLNADDPAFGISWAGTEVTAYKKLFPDERFVGLGEKTGNLDRRGRGYVNWNTDSFAYNPESDPIYGSYPFYIGIHNKVVYGIFLDNSHKSHFNFGASNERFSSFMAESGDMNYYFFAGDSVRNILQNYGNLTGTTPIPPKWSLGYQQCRYSYYPDTKVESIAKGFRDRNIPADTIVLDIHYMDEYKIFTWDKEKFPDPERLIRNLEDMNFNVVVMCDPGIKIENGYEPYEEGIEDGHFIEYPDGEAYRGEVWPGWCHFPDFTRKETRKWWGNKLKAYTKIGIQGYWNDMNEIATWGQMLPENIVFDYDGNPGLTKKGRNIYGFQMARSTYIGAKENLGGRRPFNLTRAGFSGVQRYSAVWTGDNYASEDHMMLGIRIVNSLGLSGVVFTGYDIGGFVGDASGALFARWISIGAFSPFFRGHSMINSRDAEPWAFGEQVEEICRNYIALRYQLMPYIYSLFFESWQNNMPLTRSLVIDYPHESIIYSQLFQNQYFFGDALLICPVTSDQKYVKAWLPEGTWYHLFSGRSYDGNAEVIVDASLEMLPVFARGGSVIPFQPEVMHTGEDPGDTLICHVYGEGDYQFAYYEDDGKTFEYEQGVYYSRTIKHYANKRLLVFEPAVGKMDSRFKKLKLIFHGISIGEAREAEEYYTFRYLEPITEFDPLGEFNELPLENVWSMVTENSSGLIEINY